uniref:Uncharacterized protein n=1 Tax=Spongospora subterranea TaxID=70186 RepID=A0A0H5QX51_9EUKA|eukprot:CRZ06186.1 hypothetical protein [Spongospora subterranea]
MKTSSTGVRSSSGLDSVSVSSNMDPPLSRSRIRLKPSDWGADRHVLFAAEESKNKWVSDGVSHVSYFDENNQPDLHDQQTFVFKRPGDIPPSPMPPAPHRTIYRRDVVPVKSIVDKGESDRKRKFGGDLIVVNRRETAQALLDLIKVRSDAVHYQSIRDVLRELASTKVGSGCSGTESVDNSQGSTASRATDLMERLRQLLLSIPGCVKLRLCERMAEFLPPRFTQSFLDVIQRPAAKQFASLIKERNPEQYRKFVVQVESLRTFNKSVRDRQKAEVSACADEALKSATTSTSFTNDERAVVHEMCNSTITILLALDRTFPVTFQSFINQVCCHPPLFHRFVRFRLFDLVLCFVCSDVMMP